MPTRKTNSQTTKSFVATGETTKETVIKSFELLQRAAQSAHHAHQTLIPNPKTLSFTKTPFLSQYTALISEIRTRLYRTILDSPSRARSWASSPNFQSRPSVICLYLTGHLFLYVWPRSAGLHPSLPGQAVSMHVEFFIFFPHI